MHPEFQSALPPLSRVACVQPGLLLLNELGLPIDQLLSQSRLPHFGWDDPQALLPTIKACEMLAKGEQITGMEDLGLRAGERTHVLQLGHFGRIVMQSLTLRQALMSFTELLPLYHSCSRSWISGEGDRVLLCHSYLESITTGRRYAEQLTLMILINLVRSAAGSHWRPREIHLEAAATPAVAGYDSLSETHVRFRQGCTAISLPLSLLSLPLKPDDIDADLGLLRASAVASDLPGILRQVIGTWLPQGDPGIDTMAEVAGLSARTLRRRLADEGLTYSQLVDQVRFGRARHLLRDPAVQITDIALAVGYTAVPNFTRAFRRWTGVSPSEFRRLREQEEERGEMALQG